MKAYNAGGHYHIHIGEKKEFPSLMKKSLETNLQDDSGSYLDKKVVLKYDSDEKAAKVEFVPPESSWDDLKEIQVTITKNQYDLLGSQRLYVHRFGGANSIDLHLEEDISDFI